MSSSIPVLEQLLIACKLAHAIHKSELPMTLLHFEFNQVATTTVAAQYELMHFVH
jgi:hypothetical protein